MSRTEAICRVTAINYVLGDQLSGRTLTAGPVLMKKKMHRHRHRLYSGHLTISQKALEVLRLIDALPAVLA